MKGIGIQVVDSIDEGQVMDLKIIPERNTSGKIESGLVINDTLEQNKAFLLMAQQGEIKANPGLGIGISDLLLGDSSDLLKYRHKIRQQFAVDGLKITQLQLYPNKPIKIEANYE